MMQQKLLVLSIKRVANLFVYMGHVPRPKCGLLLHVLFFIERDFQGCVRLSIFQCGLPLILK